MKIKTMKKKLGRPAIYTPEEKLQKRREYDRAYQEKNKETIKARRRAYYKKNKKILKEITRAYYKKNEQAIKRKAKVNRHPTEIVAQLKYLLAVAKTRANRAGIKFNISLDQALHIYYSQNGKCAYSKKTFTMGIPNCPFKMSPDQIIPGGGYTKENVQFVTSTINKMKLNLTPKVFVQVITDIYENLNSN
jgi:hypothetical protein